MSQVSILTQPIGWVHRYTGGSIAVAGFNPHPTDRLGVAYLLPPYLPFWFQSSPNLSVGCIATPVAVSLAPGSVSILAQPLGWVQCHNLCQFQSSPNLSVGCLKVDVVSILTQPLGLGAAVGHLLVRRLLGRFNPHPTSRPGASLHWWQSRLGWGLVRFQSSPNLSVRCSIPVGADVGGLL